MNLLQCCACLWRYRERRIQRWLLWPWPATKTTRRCKDTTLPLISFPPSIHCTLPLFYLLPALPSFFPSSRSLSPSPSPLSLLSSLPLSLLSSLPLSFPPFLPLSLPLSLLPPFFPPLSSTALFCLMILHFFSSDSQLRMRRTCPLCCGSVHQYLPTPLPSKGNWPSRNRTKPFSRLPKTSSATSVSHVMSHDHHMTYIVTWPSHDHHVTLTWYHMIQYFIL